MLFDEDQHLGFFLGLILGRDDDDRGVGLRANRSFLFSGSGRLRFDDRSGA
ncbi:hypothetical protein [Arthrobacter zhaoguopingii]|uniref:hypothetical protein n=1 Tax=Arthrobacter zhaoguopingii TaxID=2681491 RepID=UPI0013580FE8|nr:hypothetical protein [Arthrobacter zhaoguopingii]